MEIVIVAWVGLERGEEEIELFFQESGVRLRVQ
jgi:hypothetical protein